MKLKAYITITLTQMLLAFCVVGYGYTQYTNQVNITPNQDEYTFNYNWDRDTLVSVTAVSDSLWTNEGYGTYHFKKYDDNFNVVIDKRYVDTNYIYGFGRSMAYLNGYYYAGGFKDSAYYLNDTTSAFLLKFDSLGNKIWENIYYPDYIKSSIKFVVPHDSLIVFCGYTRDTNLAFNNRLETFLTAIDTNGAIIWEKTFNGFNQSPVNLKTTSDGGFILTSYTQLNGVNGQTKVYKLDNMGNTQWEQTLGDLNFVNNEFKSHWLGVEEMPNGEYLCFGWQTVWNVKKSWLVKLANDGNIIKDTLYNFSGTLVNYFNPNGNVIFTSDGAYIFGWYQDVSNVLAHSYLAYVNNDLELQWFRHFEQRTYSDLITHITPYPPNPDYLFMGGVSFSDDTTNTNDEWFIVVDSLGCDVFGCSVGIEEPQKPNTTFSIYPNPSNGKVTFQLRQQAINFTTDNYEIVITDMQGKLVKILPVNSVSISYEFVKQQRGVYLIHLVKNKQRVQTQKLILIE